MPWQTTGQTLTPNTNTYVAGSIGDGLVLQGSDPNAVGLTFVDATRSTFFAAVGFANAINDWITGANPGDIVLQSRGGRVEIGSGPASDTPQLMICSADKSSEGRRGLYLTEGSVNFLGLTDVNGGTGEFILSERRDQNGNLYGLDFYTGYSLRLAITNDGVVDVRQALRVGQGGITFSDGSVQRTATLQGPPGKDGKNGKDGLNGRDGKDRIAKSSAICGGASCFGVCHNTLVAEQAGPCVVTSETGSCETQIQGQVCCVCT